MAIRAGGNGATTGNGWVRPINFAPGMTRWIGTWADAGGDTCGGQIWSYSAGWTNTATPTVTKDATGINITATVASLGLIPGETFAFDVYTSGGCGGDGAVDALSYPGISITNWADTYTTGPLGNNQTAELKFTMPGTLTFADWSADNANGGTFNQDFDEDGTKNGLEYFMGEISSTFTPNPQVVAGVVTWPHSSAATGVSFKVRTSQNLSTWTDVTASVVNSGGTLKYTLPTTTPKLFVRLEVSAP